MVIGGGALLFRACLVTALAVMPSYVLAASEITPLDPALSIELEEVMVRGGQRASLATVQEIKRNKYEIVDAIVAGDIHKLPDFNVTDALQRVTGIQILRDRGEGAGIAIRGLTQIETLFNGREVFTAGNGRNLDFADIAADMISAIHVYKTSSASHIEGGLGGMVDLRTHRPFDFSGREVVVSGRWIHGDLIDDEKPQLSLLASNRWKTGAGEFGALVNLLWQERAWREDQKSTGNPVARTNIFPGQTVIAPNGTSETTSVGERERLGASVVLEWQPNQHMGLYAELHHAYFKTIQDSYQLNVTPTAGGDFLAGSASLFPGTSDIQHITWTNPSTLSLGFGRDTVDRTTQIALGGSWSGDALTVRSDLSYTRSYNNLDFTSINLSGSAASLTQDFTSTPPVTAVSGTDLLDVGSYSTVGMTHAKRPFEGDLTALQLDGEYQFVSDFLETLSVGLRHAWRDASNGPGQVVFTSSVPVANGAGLLISNPYNDFFPGSADIGRYLVGNPKLTRDAEALRQALGIAATIPDSNPLGSWAISEDTTAAYAMLNFGGGAYSLSGNAGLRMVYTRAQVEGFRSDPLSGGVLPVSLGGRYTDFLPSMNLRYELMPGLYLRGAASKTLTRPDFNQLSPSLTLHPTLLNGTGGNPELNPIRADNFDMSIEKYFSRTTSVSLTAFHKNVDGFLTTVSSPETYDGVTYQVSRPRNTNKAAIRGVEIGYQQFYDFLPSWLSGLGLQANYTYVDSKTPSSILGQDVPLQNLSRHSYNIIGMYEKNDFSARIAFNWRDRFLSSVANIVGVGALPVYMEDYGWLDASLAYKLSPQMTVALEGGNLLRTQRKAFYSVKTRPQSSWVNDRQVILTLTMRF